MDFREMLFVSLLKRQQYGKRYLIVDRPSHRGLYIIAASEKRLWTEDEELLFDTDLVGSDVLTQRLADAWYAADCPPLPTWATPA